MPRKYQKSTTKKALSNLKKLAYRSKIGAKLSQLNTTNLFYSLREVNDIDQGKGKVQLSASSTTRNDQPDGNGSLPLVAIPMLNVIQNGVASNGLYMLQNRALNFSGSHPIEYSGQSGNTVNEATSIQLKKMLLRYVDLRLMLWQNASKDVKFKCYLVKLYDEELSPLVDYPYSTDQGSWTNEQHRIAQKRRLLWYYHFLRAQTSSPLIETQEGFLKPIKGKYKILWEKEYHIQELHGNMEEKHYQQVNFFKRFDKIIDFTDPSSYVNNPITPAGDNDPDEVKYITAPNNCNNQPQLKNQLFFVITANASYGEGDSGSTATMDKMTFDIAMKTKWTIPSGNKAFST